MKLTTSAALSVLLATCANAACYPKGAPWPSKHAGTVEHIQHAAHFFATLSPLAIGEHEHNIPFDGKCLHFILDNISDKARSITANEAADGFFKEYRGCAHGGDTSYTNWRYV